MIVGWSTEHNGTYYSINGVATAVNTHETGGTFTFKMERISNIVRFFIDEGSGFVEVASSNKPFEVDEAKIRFANDAGGLGNNASASFLMTNYIFDRSGVELTEDFIIFEETDDMDATEILVARRQAEVTGTGVDT